MRMRLFSLVILASIVVLVIWGLFGCALPGSAPGSPRGIPVAVAAEVLRGLAADVETFDVNRDGVVAGPELSGLGLQAGLRLAAKAQELAVAASSRPSQ